MITLEELNKGAVDVFKKLFNKPIDTPEPNCTILKEGKCYVKDGKLRFEGFEIDFGGNAVTRELVLDVMCRYINEQDFVVRNNTFINTDIPNSDLSIYEGGSVPNAEIIYLGRVDRD